MRRVALAFVIALGTCALVLVPHGDLDAAPSDAGPRPDGPVDAPLATTGCHLNLAGGTYAIMDGTVRHETAISMSFDAAIQHTRVHITGGGMGAFPSVDLWFDIGGEPQAGSQWNALVVGHVQKAPATWRVIASGSGTTGGCSLEITRVDKIAVYGGTSYRVYGRIACTMPEVTGVRGPDVVLTAVF